jgi:predicted RNase H-like nuclease
MPVLCGADGCKDGWVVATQDIGSGKTSTRRADSIQQICNTDEALVLLAIDVPIGLPDAGPRGCDIEARARLGRPRGSSVFPAPIRPMLSARSHAHACRIGRQCDGRGLTVQCWHILPKIREVDAYLREHPSDRTRIREVHPEVSFMLLAGRPMTYPKRQLAGRRERIALLEPVFGDAVLRAIENRKTIGAAPDDILDAFAALWSAKGVFDNAAVTFPARGPELDAEGIPMEIVA